MARICPTDPDASDVIQMMAKVYIRRGQLQPSMHDDFTQETALLMLASPIEREDRSVKPIVARVCKSGLGRVWARHQGGGRPNSKPIEDQLVLEHHDERKRMEVEQVGGTLICHSRPPRDGFTTEWMDWDSLSDDERAALILSDKPIGKGDRGEFGSHVKNAPNSQATTGRNTGGIAPWRWPGHVKTTTSQQERNVGWRRGKMNELRTQLYKRVRTSLEARAARLKEAS